MTGRSHRLKQMTHFKVSSSRSGFLLVSAAFLACSFFRAPAAHTTAVDAAHVTTRYQTTATSYSKSFYQ